jgi:hypothetical protein
MVGSRLYARAGWEPLSHRAAGYLRKPPEGTATLSRGQVDRALQYLVGRGLWQVYGYTGAGKHVGVRYWSNRLPLEKLVALIEGQKSKRNAYSEMIQQGAKLAASAANAPASY